MISSTGPTPLLVSSTSIYSIIVAPKRHFTKEKVLGKLSESFDSMTWGNCFNKVYAIDLPNQNLQWEDHYEYLPNKDDFMTVDSIWEEITTQADKIEKDLLLMECMHSFWQSKHNQDSDVTFDWPKISELCEGVLKALKQLTSGVFKVEETFTLEMYKFWRKSQNMIDSFFKELHWVGGEALSYLMANKIFDEVEYIANDDSRLSEAQKNEGHKIYGKSFDILSLMGSFEKPIGTDEQVRARISRRYKPLCDILGPSRLFRVYLKKILVSAWRLETKM